MDGVIRGVVRSSTGPIPFARVIVASAPGPMPDIALLTDAAGRFAVHPPYPGRYVLAVHADGYLPGRLDTTVVPPDEPAEAVVTLDRGT